MENDRDEDTLEACREEVRRLTDENRQLRESSQTFGDLAERLKSALDSERRTGRDRRFAVRPDAERRQTPTPD